jgi:RNA polymerase sigma-70 factor (ECF subfamily)
MSQQPSTPAHAAALLLKHRDSLYAYVLACVRSFADADDVLQTASVAIIESTDVPMDDARFLAWARELTRRRVLEHFRRAKRVLPLDPEVIASLADAAERVERRQSGVTHRQALLECLERLPPESQQLLQARYDGSASDSTSLARRFGRSEQAVQSLLYRIRNALRECVERRLRLEGAS